MAKKTLIADGWRTFEAMVVPADAPEAQRKDMRKAFFCGASLLFTGLMMLSDPGDEPTDADMQRMSDLQDEIDAFGHELDRDVLEAIQKARH